MPICAFCKDPVPLPPDMVDEPFEEGEHRGKRICHFCKFKKDVLIGKDGTVYKKEEVIADYKKFCDEVYYKPELFTKFNKSMVDGAVTHSIAQKNAAKAKESKLILK